MTYFTQDCLDFLKELAANNHRDWFLANKKRYEKSVKQPFYDFVQTMIDRVHAVDNRVMITPKDAIFRINRDIRFSADKSPYKTFLSAVISAGGRKDHSSPGLYLQFGPEDARIYSGAYTLEKNQLQAVREAIAGNLDTFDKLLNDGNFKKKFGTIHGEEHKRLPGEFQEAAEKQPLLYKKSFYYFAKFEPGFILKDDLPDTVMEYYQAAKPMSAFLEKAMNAS